MRGRSLPAVPKHLTPTEQSVRFTLAINHEGWKIACARHGLYGDTAVAAHIGVSYPTLWRVLNGKLAPGPTFVAQACMRLGNYYELFIPVPVSSAA